MSTPIISLEGSSGIGRARRSQTAPETKLESSGAKSTKLRWPVLPASIAFVTALISVATLMTLDHFTCSELTSDLVGAAASLAPGVHTRTLEFLAIPVFLAGVVLVYTLVRRCGPKSATAIRSVLGTEAAVLACACVLSVTDSAAANPHDTHHVAIGVLAVLAVSLSNTGMHMIDKTAATTWALTANIVAASIALMNLITRYGTAEDLEKDRERWRAIWPVVLMFLVGSLVGAIIIPRLHKWLWLLPTGTALCVLAMAWRSGTHESDADGVKSQGRKD